MKEELNVYYDDEGDFLEIRIGKPSVGYFKDIGNDVFERIDDATGEIRGFAIFNFKKRTEKLRPVEVALPVTLKINR